MAEVVGITRRAALRGMGAAVLAASGLVAAKAAPAVDPHGDANRWINEATSRGYQVYGVVQSSGRRTVQIGEMDWDRVEDTALFDEYRRITPAAVFAALERRGEVYCAVSGRRTLAAS